MNGEESDTKKIEEDLHNVRAQLAVLKRWKRKRRQAKARKRLAAQLKALDAWKAKRASAPAAEADVSLSGVSAILNASNHSLRRRNSDAELGGPLHSSLVYPQSSTPVRAASAREDDESNNLLARLVFEQGHEIPAARDDVPMLKPGQLIAAHPTRVMVVTLSAPDAASPSEVSDAVSVDDRTFVLSPAPPVTPRARLEPRASTPMQELLAAQPEPVRQAAATVKTPPRREEPTKGSGYNHKSISRRFRRFHQLIRRRNSHQAVATLAVL